MVDYRRYIRKKELAYFTIEFDQEITEALVIKMLILFDNYFPKYLISDDNDFAKAVGKYHWKEFVLYKNLFSDENMPSYYLMTPLFIQENNIVNIVHFDNSITFALFFRKNIQNKNSILISFYVNLYTDIINRFDPKDTDGIRKIKEDQSKAAKKNRFILTQFLRELESFLKGEIVEYLSDYTLQQGSVFKYGINEDAKMNETDAI